MGQIAKEGRTVLFVSHNLAAVEALCQSALVLDGGKIIFFGDTQAATQQYTRRMSDNTAKNIALREDRSGLGFLRFNSMQLEGEVNAGGLDVIATGNQLSIGLELQLARGATAPKRPIDLAVIVRDSRGQKVTTFANFFTGQCLLPSFYEDRWRLSCVVNDLPLLPGEYNLDLWCAHGSELIDFVPDAQVLTVSSCAAIISDDARKPIAHKHGSVFVAHNWLENPKNGFPQLQ
jgi:lipopolysaccharide transport system ATP-binding protein